MEYRIKVLNGGQIYRVPEDMIPRVAVAMVEGGTAVKIEERKVESASLVNRTKEVAARVGNALGVHTAAKR